MLTILHLNDTDTRDPALWARAAAAIRQLRARDQCDLLLHSGDVTLGAPGTVDLLNDLSADAIVPGNHDLDIGPSAAHAQLSNFRGLALCCNIAGFVPAALIERQGLRIGLAGVLTPDAALLLPERFQSELAVADPIPVLQARVPALRRQADLVILLSHCGLSLDRRIAAAVPGIDLIVGGHSHHLLPEPIRVGQTAIVQAGAHGGQVGMVTIQAPGQVFGRVIATDRFVPDPFALACGEPPHEADDTIVGHTASDLRSADYACETPLGNLTADLMRQHAGTDLALLRCSSVNNAWPPGPLRQRDIAGLNYCADDQVAIVELTGAQLWAVLECGARDRYYLLTLSGGRVAYDGGQPEGARVVQVSLQDLPLDRNGTYTVACSEILARGAAGFTPLQGMPYRLSGATVGQLLAAHIQAQTWIKPACDGRLVISGALPAAR